MNLKFLLIFFVVIVIAVDLVEISFGVLNSEITTNAISEEMMKFLVPV